MHAPRGDFAHGWRWGELLTTVALGAAILVAWRLPYAEVVAYPFRLFATFVHELSHGLAAVVTGGRFDRFLVHADLSGTAWSAGGIRWIVASAGYVGCALAGNVLVVLAARRVSSRGLLVALGLALALACLAFVRNPFGLVTGLALAAALMFAGWRLAAGWRDAFLLVLAVQLVLDGFNSLLDLVVLSNDAAVHTDARTLAELSGLPAILWAVSWSALSLAMLVVALRVAYRGRAASPSGRGVTSS